MRGERNGKKIFTVYWARQKRNFKHSQLTKPEYTLKLQFVQVLITYMLVVCMKIKQQNVDVFSRNLP